MQPGHLEDVVSTDQHTVKPWFDGRLDFAPPVKNLAAIGFPLKGGRLDYVDGRPVAALVYQRGKHIIDLYVWPQGGEGMHRTSERHGYNVVHWTHDGMTLLGGLRRRAKTAPRFRQSLGTLALSREQR